jgi:hypothetical protein
MDHGIQIYLPKLNTLSISTDQTLVTVGGGINSKTLTDALWAAGKQTGKSGCITALSQAATKQLKSRVHVNVSASWVQLLEGVMVGSRVTMVWCRINLPR